MKLLCVQRDLNRSSTLCLGVEPVQSIPLSRRSEYIRNLPPHAQRILITRDQSVDVYRTSARQIFTGRQIHILFGAMPDNVVSIQGGHEITLRDVSGGPYTALQTSMLFFTGDDQVFELSPDQALRYRGPTLLYQNVHAQVLTEKVAYDGFIRSTMAPLGRSDMQACQATRNSSPYLGPTGEVYDYPRIQERIHDLVEILNLDELPLHTEVDCNLRIAGAASDLASGRIFLGRDFPSRSFTMQNTVLSHELGHFFFHDREMFSLNTYLAEEFNRQVPRSACSSQFVYSRVAQSREGQDFSGDLNSEAYARLMEVVYFYEGEWGNLFEMSEQDRNRYYRPNTMAIPWFQDFFRGEMIQGIPLALALSYFLYQAGQDTQVVQDRLFDSLCRTVEREVPPAVFRKVRDWTHPQRDASLRPFFVAPRRACNWSTSSSH